LLIVAPILVVPSLSGLVTAIGPLVNRLVLGRVDPDVAATGAVVVALGVVALLGLLLFGGAVDAWLIGLAGTSLDLDASPAAHPTAARLAAARVLAHLPLLAVIALSLGPIVGATYRELVNPGDIGMPIAVRVIARESILVGFVVVTAILCDVLAALAVRAVALEDTSVLGSVPVGLGVMVRRPLDTLTGAIGSIVVTLVLIPPALFASAVAFEGLGSLLANGAEGAPAAAAGAILFLVAIFLGGLILAGIATAWRSFAWTAVYARATGMGPSRGWYGGRPSGTLPPEVTG
jgi:hypothetical protein